ncbi:MAG TPA: PH domain-containing protein [Actinomycetota bacterium]|nr:PH domain-containing protein [Actinomycetota bacterium]
MKVSQRCDGERVWRPNRAARAAGCVFILGGIAVGAYLALHHRPDLATLAALFAIGGWRYGLHPSLAATAEGIVIRNPFRRIVVPWRQVEGALPGSSGLIVLRTDRRPVRAWAVQKANWSHFLGKRRRADEVAEYLIRSAKRRRATP